MSEAIRKHAIRYPNARTSTLVYKENVERKTEQLRAELAAARKRRAGLIERVKKTGLWPSWIWRG